MWETLNRLLSGHVEPMHLLLSVPCLVLLYLLLRLTARRLPGIVTGVGGTLMFIGVMLFFLVVGMTVFAGGTARRAISRFRGR